MSSLRRYVLWLVDLVADLRFTGPVVGRGLLGRDANLSPKTGGDDRGGMPTIWHPQQGSMTAYDTWGLPVEDDTVRLVDDVNQPLAAIQTSAEAALTWLQHDPPNLAEAKDALALALDNSHRAVDLVRIVQTSIQHRSSAVVDMDEEGLTGAAIMRAAAYPGHRASSGDGHAHSRSEIPGLARQIM